MNVTTTTVAEQRRLRRRSLGRERQPMKNVDARITQIEKKLTLKERGPNNLILLGVPDDSPGPLAPNSYRMRDIDKMDFSQYKSVLVICTDTRCGERAPATE